MYSAMASSEVTLAGGSDRATMDEASGSVFDIFRPNLTASTSVSRSNEGGN